MAFFQDLTSRKAVFHTLVRWMRSLKDALFKRFRPYAHNMGPGGDPRMFGTAGCCPRIRHTNKTYDILVRTYDIVCEKKTSMITTISYVRHTTSYDGHTILYVKKGTCDVVYYMNLQCRMYNAYDIICISDLRYRIRYVFLVGYDIVCM
jgi:hypothetical protein